MKAKQEVRTKKYLSLIGKVTILEQSALISSILADMADRKCRRGRTFLDDRFTMTESARDLISRVKKNSSAESWTKYTQYESNQKCVTKSSMPRERKNYTQNYCNDKKGGSPPPATSSKRIRDAMISAQSLLAENYFH